MAKRPDYKSFKEKVLKNEKVKTKRIGIIHVYVNLLLPC